MRIRRAIASLVGPVLAATVLLTAPVAAQAGSWSPPVTLASYQGALAFPKKVFPSSNGSSVVVWRMPDLTGFQPSFHAAAVKPSGGFTALSGLPPIGEQLFAGNDRGEVVTIGSVNMFGGQDFVQRLQPGASTFGTGIPVWGPDELSEPPIVSSLTMDSTGLARVAYVKTGVGDWSYSQRSFGPSGAGPETDLLPPFDPDGGTFTGPWAAVDSGDVTSFAWTTGSGPDFARGTTIDADGIHGPVIPLASRPYSGFVAWGQTMDVGPPGSARIAWVDPGPSGSAQLRIAAMSGGGGVTFASSTHPAALSEPGLTVGSDGTAHVFWSARDGDYGTDWVLRTRTVSPAGELGTVRQLAGGYSNGPLVSAAAEAGGVVMVALVTSDGNVVARRINADGTFADAGTELGNGDAPVVGIDGDGFATVAWAAVGTDPGTRKVVFRRYEPVDVRPPNTAIRSGPTRITTSTRATFRHFSSEPGSRFRCRLDRRPFRACAARVTYRGLKNGRHVFRVYAVDRAGLADPSPALRSWTVKPKRKPARHRR